MTTERLIEILNNNPSSYRESRQFEDTIESMKQACNEAIDEMAQAMINEINWATLVEKNILRVADKLKVK